ncbi:MAG: hypothetical protein IPK58_14625 [Acidobacteria bacterium]|nr:hypothetical protein [Acidobacteriota bacterium]
MFAPDVFENPDAPPKNAFEPPSRLLAPEFMPKKEFEFPIVFDEPAYEPKNEFDEPVVLTFPVCVPKKALNPPVLTGPELNPANMFSFPEALKIRPPFRLNCAAASKMLDLPVPLMLKFELAC